MITLSHISKRYFSLSSQSTFDVLQDCTTHISSGEVIAIVGPSGCGKSTLLKILAGLMPADSGEIIMNNNSENLVPKNRYISQQPALLPWLSVEKNLSFGLDIMPISSKEKQEKIEYYLRITGLEPFAKQYPKDLSGGMQQRLSLARTLATSPDILLMDEPFSSLDTQNRSYLQDFLIDILRREKVTTIVVTHDPEEAIYLADRILVLSPRPGKIIEDIPIPFSKERTASIKYTEEFQRIKRYISYLLYAESIRVKTDNTIQKQQGMIIGSNIWPGVLPFYLAQQEHLYEKYHLHTPHFLTMEWSDTDRFMPLREGIVDILNVPLDMALIEYDKYKDIEIIMPIDVSCGGDILLAHHTCSSLQELRNKKIAVETSWTSFFFLAYLLDTVGMSTKDIEIHHSSTRYIPGALLNKQVDGAVLQEPWYSQVKMLSDYRILGSTTNHPIIYSVLVTKKDFATQHREDIKKLQQTIRHAIAIYKESPVYAIEKVSSLFGVSNSDLKEQLQSVLFLEDSQSMINDLPKIVHVLRKECLITNKNIQQTSLFAT